MAQGSGQRWSQGLLALFPSLLPLPAPVTAFSGGDWHPSVKVAWPCFGTYLSLNQWLRLEDSNWATWFTYPPFVRVWGDTWWGAPPGPHEVMEGLHQGSSPLIHPQGTASVHCGVQHLLPQKISQFLRHNGKSLFVRAERNFAGWV